MTGMIDTIRMLLSHCNKKNSIFLNRLILDLKDQHSFNTDPDVDAKLISYLILYTSEPVGRNTSEKTQSHNSSYLSQFDTRKMNRFLSSKTFSILGGVLFLMFKVTLWMTARLGSVFGNYTLP